MAHSGYIPGDFWRICDRCGFKTRASQTFRTWDGLYVCAEDFETRHPQDFVRGRKDVQNVPDPRPESVDVFISPLDPIQCENELQLETEAGFYLTTESRV